VTPLLPSRDNTMPRVPYPVRSRFGLDWFISRDVIAIEDRDTEPFLVEPLDLVDLREQALGIEPVRDGEMALRRLRSRPHRDTLPQTRESVGRTHRGDAGTLATFSPFLMAPGAFRASLAGRIIPHARGPRRPKSPWHGLGSAGCAALPDGGR